MQERITRCEFLKRAGGAVLLITGALGSRFRPAEAAPPGDESERNKICLEGENKIWENKICIEKPKPVEIPKLREIITVSGFSEGEGGRKVKEKRAIHSCEGEEGIWGVVWHQLVAKLVKTEEGEWYENFSQVCFTTVKEKGIYSPAQVLREWSVPKEKVEQAPQMLPRIYHDLRSGKAVSRDLASSEVAATTELGVGWSAHPVIVPHKEGFSVYYWASRNEQSEMPRIYRQNILPEGRLGSLFLEVGNGQAWRKFYPSAVVDEEGNHYVFWEQDYEERPGAFEIWAQKLDPNGEETGDSFPVSLMPYSQHPKAVLVDEEIWVSWEYPYIDNKGRAQIDVFCQRLTKEGELIRESFPIFQDGKDQNGVHEMAVNSYGEVVTVRAASDGKIWGRLMGENWMSEPQILAKEEGKLMVHAGVAPFGKEGFLISFYKFRPWESVFGQAYGLAVEVRNPGRGSLDEGQGVMKVDGWPIPPLDKKWLAVSPVFLLSSEIGQQFTSVSGGRDSAFFAWENRWDRVRNPDGSQILGRFATPGMFP